LTGTTSEAKLFLAIKVEIPNNIPIAIGAKFHAYPGFWHFQERFERNTDPVPIAIGIGGGISWTNQVGSWQWQLASQGSRFKVQ